MTPLGSSLPFLGGRTLLTTVYFSTLPPLASQPSLLLVLLPPLCPPPPAPFAAGIELGILQVLVFLLCRLFEPPPPFHFQLQRSFHFPEPLHFPPRSVSAPQILVSDFPVY